MKHLAFRAAATTLGYIAGNTRGAYRSYQMAKRSTYGRLSRKSPASRNAKKSLGVSAASRRAHSVSKRRKPVSRRRTITRFVAKSRAPRRSSKRGSSFSNAIAKTGGSSFRLGSGPRLYSGFKRTQQPVTFTSTCTSRIAAASGKQAVGLLPTYRISLGTNDTSDTLIQSNNTIESPLLDRAGKWLEAYQASSSSTGAGTAAPEGFTATQKFVCNYLMYDQAIRNCEVQDVTLTIYDCVLRAGVSPNYHNYGQAAVNINPINDWHVGLQNEYNPAAPYAYLTGTYDSPATTPFMSTQFCKLYKIKKTTKVVLAAGAVHHHRVTVKPRNMFDMASGNNIVGSVANTQDRGFLLPGISGFTLITVLGSIADSAANTNNISTTKTAVDCVTTTKASFAQFSRERRFHMTFDGLVLGATDLRAVQDDTGTIQADTTANEG